MTNINKVAERFILCSFRTSLLMFLAHVLNKYSQRLHLRCLHQISVINPRLLLLLPVVFHIGVSQFYNVPYDINPISFITFNRMFSCVQSNALE